jgi:hypothetical protein
MGSSTFKTLSAATTIGSKEKVTFLQDKIVLTL